MSSETTYHPKKVGFLRRARFALPALASVAALTALGGVTPAEPAGAATTDAASSGGGVAALSAPAIGMALDSATGGYWEVGSDGSVAALGAPYYGSMSGHPLNEPVVGIAATPTGGGYWEVASDGGIFSFGNATFKGSMGGHPLNKPIVAIATDRQTGGYWEVASDGGLFAFTAPFYGSMGGQVLNKPIVGMVATPTGGGYLEVASDGGIFAFGNAAFKGSMGGTVLNEPIVGIASDPATGGYWEVASDGGLFSFTAPFDGSMGGQPLAAPVVGMVATPTGGGYWEVSADGAIYTFGNATFSGAGTVITPHPLLPPQEPPADIPANPAYSFEAGVTVYPGGTSIPPCWQVTGGNFEPAPTSSWCIGNEVAALNSARSLEGLQAMALPSNFAQLTPAEQLLVVTDIERVSRGETPVLGLTSQLDADAQAAAQRDVDPTFSFATIPGSMWWGSNVASGSINALSAAYTWMYFDGPGGTNAACSDGTGSACWGHRNNMLDERQNLVMGAGEVAGGGGLATVTELLVSVTNPGNLPAMTYTWADAVAAGAGV